MTTATVVGEWIILMELVEESGTILMGLECLQLLRLTASQIHVGSTEQEVPWLSDLIALPIKVQKNQLEPTAVRYLVLMESWWLDALHWREVVRDKLLS